MTNERAGTVGAGLAAGVLQPGLGAASRQIGRQLTPFVPARAYSSLTRAFLADPVTVATAQYRPLPSHSALGLSAFYIALLILMCPDSPWPKAVLEDGWSAALWRESASCRPTDASIKPG